MCCKGDSKVRQYKSKTVQVCAPDMKEAGECLALGGKMGRKRNAMSAVENWQKEEGAIDDSQVKFGFVDDRSRPGRVLRRKSDEEEVCVTPVKPSSVFAADKNENSPGKNLPTLPLDVLVEVVCNLGHHELEPLCFVSKDFKEAVKVAKKTHFAFKTPDHGRRHNRLFFQNGSPTNSSSVNDSPVTPKAPKRAGKHRNPLLTDKDLAELSRVLFFDSNKPTSVTAFDTERTISSKPVISTNRVLFSEDDISGVLSRHSIE